MPNLLKIAFSILTFVMFNGCKSQSENEAETLGLFSRSTADIESLNKSLEQTIALAKRPKDRTEMAKARKELKGAARVYKQMFQSYLDKNSEGTIAIANSTIQDIVILAESYEIAAEVLPRLLKVFRSFTKQKRFIELASLDKQWPYLLDFAQIVRKGEDNDVVRKLFGFSLDNVEGDHLPEHHESFDQFIRKRSPIADKLNDTNPKLIWQYNIGTLPRSMLKTYDSVDGEKRSSDDEEHTFFSPFLGPEKVLIVLVPQNELFQLCFVYPNKRPKESFSEALQEKLNDKFSVTFTLITERDDPDSSVDICYAISVENAKVLNSFVEEF